MANHELLILKEILDLSNIEKCQSAEDMQNALEKIHETIKENYPDLEED